MLKADLINFWSSLSILKQRTIFGFIFFSDSRFSDFQIQGFQLERLMGNWPEEPSGPNNAEFSMIKTDVGAVGDRSTIEIIDD